MGTTFFPASSDMRPTDHRVEWSSSSRRSIMLRLSSAVSPILFGISKLNDVPSLARTRSSVTPETRKRQSAAARARWADPIAGAKWRAAVNEAAKARRADPTFAGPLFSSASRAKIGEATKARWADPAAREKMIAKMRASNADPVVRRKRATAIRKRWADPAMREQMLAGMRTTTKRRRKRDNADR
jgi:hypothetical protein